MTTHKPDPAMHSDPELEKRCPYCHPRVPPLEPIIPEIKPALGIERKWDGYCSATTSPTPYFPRGNGGGWTT